MLPKYLKEIFHKICKGEFNMDNKEIFEVVCFNETHNVSMGIRVHITEQTRDTYRGGGVIPLAMPLLLTSSKYSREPIKTEAAKARVKTHPPANTTPPTGNPMAIPKITLFLSWLAFFCLSSTFCKSWILPSTP